MLSITREDSDPGVQVGGGRKTEVVLWGGGYWVQRMTS